jgi:5-methylcytosine-specific restriction endonuclease McrA
MNKTPTWISGAYKSTDVYWGKSQAKIMTMLEQVGIDQIRFTSMPDRFILESYGMTRQAVHNAFRIRGYARRTVEKKNHTIVDEVHFYGEKESMKGVLPNGQRVRLSAYIWRKENGSLTHVPRGESHPHWKGGISVGENRKEYLRKKVLERVARKAGAEGSHSLEEWEALKKHFNYMCLCCKQQEPFVKLTEDHITPLSMGGSDGIENIQPLCKPCNSRKSVKTLDFRSATISL